ncbi:MAG TPA: hypothetical protein VGC57_15190 [Cellulomonas sp.]
MDDHLVARVEAEDDDLQQPAGGVEAEPELSCRAAVVEVGDVDGAAGSASESAM